MIRPDRRRCQVPNSPARRSADRAWLAAILEGEGCITLTQGRTPHLGITNTDRAMLERVMAIVQAGRIRLKQPVPGSRPCYEWRVGGSSARSILALVQPYLVTKREQARIVLGHKRGTSGVPLTEAERETRWRANARLQALKRGAPEDS